VYSTCLHCHKNLGTNDAIETLPIGRRLAFDARQGRLWVVCSACAKWNLVPFDTRLESIDACERLFRDTRTRYATDNIGLARVRDGMDLIRIGAPQRPEFASWRYGAQYRRRRRRNIALATPAFLLPTVGQFAIGAIPGPALVVGAAAGLLPSLVAVSLDILIARRRRFRIRAPDGAITRLGDNTITTAGVSLHDGELSVAVAPDWHGPAWTISNWREARARGTNFDPPVTWIGGSAHLLARRILARLNAKAGSRSHLQRAEELLAAHGGHLGHWLTYPSLHRARIAAWAWNPAGEVALKYWSKHDISTVPLVALHAADRLAIEMWLSEENEARALAGELKLLERQWKQAEELARISDDLAVSDEVHQQVS
jgi:hypothetical protein